jgi:hypothetical protein
MTSLHTPFAAACAAARFPLSAFLQIPSTLALTFAGRVVALASTDLQTAAASRAPALAAPLKPLDAVAPVALVGAVEAVLAATVGLVAPAELVWLLVVELPPPQAQSPVPANNAAPASAMVGRVENLVGGAEIGTMHPPVCSSRSLAAGRLGLQSERIVISQLLRVRVS